MKPEKVKKEKEEMIEIVRGSGNVFRDLGHADADVQQLKALLAAEILKMLDREELTVRAAHSRTGIAKRSRNKASKTPKHEIDLIASRLKALKELLR